ncbi:MAG: hypothetical protein LUD00_02385 [Prevotellaceae bacterium]|nr:hypothetical protein [Prevotellaceae bacterium]
MKKTSLKSTVCTAIMCIYAITVFAAPASGTNVRNIVFTQNVNNDDNEKSGIGRYSLTESDETLYGLLSSDGMLTVELVPVIDDGAYITLYKDGEVADYLYVQDSVSLDFNEYGVTGHYTVTITSISEDTEYTADIIF